MNCWWTLCADAGFGRLRLHDLRHTAASQAVMAGKNVPVVGKILGDWRHRTTAGYAHLADTHLVEAAERIGNIIAEAMTYLSQPMWACVIPIGAWEIGEEPLISL